MKYVENKKVAVIIVSYNGMQWLQKCIDSLIESDIPLTIYLVDNASTDGTVECIKNNYSDRIKLHESPVNLGFGGANNIAMKQAYLDGFEYFFLLNQDAHVAPHAIRLLVESSLAFPEYDILSPLHYNGDGTSFDYGFDRYVKKNKDKLWYNQIKQGDFSGPVKKVKFINAAGWFLTRNCIENIGLFNPVFFHYGEDNNYVHRLNFHGLKLGVVSGSFMWHDRIRKPKDSSKKYAHQRFLRISLLELSNPANNKKIIDLQIRNLLYSIKWLVKLNVKESFKCIRNCFWLNDLKTLPINSCKLKTKTKGTQFFDGTPDF